MRDKICTCYLSIKFESGQNTRTTFGDFKKKNQENFLGLLKQNVQRGEEFTYFYKPDVNLVDRIGELLDLKLKCIIILFVKKVLLKLTANDAALDNGSNRACWTWQKRRQALTPGVSSSPSSPPSFARLLEPFLVPRERPSVKPNPSIHRIERLESKVCQTVLKRTIGKAIRVLGGKTQIIRVIE